MNDIHSYTAGYIDADGCIMLLLNSKTRKVPSLMVQVTSISIDERPLVLIQKEYGGNIIQDCKPYKGAKHVFYRYNVNGLAAVEMLNKIKNNLVIKRSQADLAIYAYNVCKEQWAETGSKGALKGESSFSNPQEVKFMRTSLHTAMKALNSKDKYLVESVND